MRLADLEKGLLEALATAEGDLLEDTSLIERLSETKATAAEIQVCRRNEKLRCTFAPTTFNARMVCKVSRLRATVQMTQSSREELIQVS